MIEHVELTNWKSHKQTELDFTGGVNAIVGEMGSGKSAVLEAITYGLFGTTPAVQERKISLDDLIRRTPTKADQAEIQVTFTVDGDSYRVERTLKRDSGTEESKLYHDSDLVAGPQTTEVTEAVEELLGIDYDLFANIIFAEQNQLDRFIDLTPSERKERIDELLKLERFEDARSNAVTLRNRVKDRHSSRQQDLEELEERLDEAEIEELADTIDDLEDELDELQETKAANEERLDELDEQVEELEQTEERVEELEKQATQLRATIDSLQEQLPDEEPDVESREQAEDRLEEIQDELDAIEERKDELQELEKQLALQESTVERLEDELGELQDEREKEDELEDVEERLGELDERLEELRDKRSSAEAELDQVTDALKDLSQSTETCPTCGQELTDEHRVEILQEKKQRKEELNERIDELDDTLDELEDEQDELEEQRDELLQYRDIDEQIEDKQDELDEAEEQLEELEEQRDELEDELDDRQQEELEEEQEQLEDAVEIFEKREMIAAKQEKLADVEDELDDIDFDEDELEGAKEERNDLESDIKVLASKTESKKELLEEKRKRMQEFEKQQERLEELQQEVERYGLLRDFLNRFERALVETQGEMRRRFVDQANSVMQEVWDRVYPYEDYTSIRLRAGDDYVLEVRNDRGDWVRVEGEVSGGERHTAALTLRIALAIVLAPTFKLLILDEPTHNLDTRAIDDMAETLRTNVADLIDQLFLITHEEQLEAAVTGSLYNLRKKETEHGLTEVEDTAL